jgi:hypothetical protein
MPVGSEAAEGCVTTDTYPGTYAETTAGGMNTLKWTFAGGTCGRESAARFAGRIRGAPSADSRARRRSAADTEETKYGRECSVEDEEGDEGRRQRPKEDHGADRDADGGPSGPRELPNDPM